MYIDSEEGMSHYPTKRGGTQICRVYAGKETQM